jgi:hypothetical protein
MSICAAARPADDKDLGEEKTSAGKRLRQGKDLGGKNDLSEEDLDEKDLDENDLDEKDLGIKKSRAQESPA